MKHLQVGVGGQPDRAANWVELEGKVMCAPAGSYVATPRRILHAGCNAGIELVRVIEFHTAAGLDRFYDEPEAVFTTDQMDEGVRRAEPDGPPRAHASTRGALRRPTVAGPSTLPSVQGD